ncbi:MAG TPA: NAD(P)-dependent oxidoreductase [Prolixibacteraceae bacterium]|nr:NAD(P)-dependent oxidoreductase [Prolixibacteraceae bacterium]
MKTGITGATGQLGRLVIGKLKEKTEVGSIVALVRNTGKAKDLGVEAREFDYDKPELLAESLKGIEQLLLISGSDLGQRARQHANVVNAAKLAGVKKIVYTSLLHTGNTTVSLAEEHLPTEEAVIESGIPYTILRDGWYTENHTNSISGVLAAGAVFGSAAGGKFSSAARADFAEAAIVVLTEAVHDGKIYELAGDAAYTLAEYAAEIAKQTGKNIIYNNLPAAEYAKVLESFGLPGFIAEAIAGWDVSASKGDLFDDSHTLSKLIGRPTTPLSEVVKNALSAF